MSEHWLEVLREGEQVIVTKSGWGIPREIGMVLASPPTQIKVQVESQAEPLVFARKDGWELAKVSVFERYKLRPYDAAAAPAIRQDVAQRRLYRALTAITFADVTTLTEQQCTELLTIVRRTGLIPPASPKETPL